MTAQPVYRPLHSPDSRSLARGWARALPERALPVLACAALAAALATPAVAQVQYELAGGSIASVTVGGQKLTPDELSTGTSTGAVQLLESGGKPITAADNLDLYSYFARTTVSPDLWAIDLDPTWRDTSGSAEDFFVFEVGGNDPLRVSARLVDGSLGQEVTFSAWNDLSLIALNGPNSGQHVHALSFSGSDLLDPSGLPLGPGDELSGIEIRSATVDGAAFVHRAVPAAPLYRPTIVATHSAVPFLDLGQTQVTLTATLPVGAPPQAFEWSIGEATFVGGSGAGDPQITLTTQAFDPLEIDLKTYPLGHPEDFQKASYSLGLKLPGGAELHGSAKKWQKLELWFDGPLHAQEDSAPNPFLDLRLDVLFLRPDGTPLLVPGFFAGDGRGSGTGRVWKVRLVPDAIGNWTYLTSFRSGPNVAVATNPLVGVGVAFDGTLGALAIEKRDTDAPGFLAEGRLVYADGPYRRQVDGGYWLKGGTNSPENLFAFRGFEGTEDQNGVDGLHEFGPHEADWTAADADIPGGTFAGDRALLGALNYLESQGVNGLYFLPFNLGGDGSDTAPFLGFANTGYDKTHYAIRRLHQWEAILWEATKRGMHLQIVLAETEPANENWLDGGQFGNERKLFFRELVARFGHHLALKWNLSEENDFSNAQLTAMAGYLRGIDPYDSPISFHVKPNEVAVYQAFYGSPLFEAASVQFSPDLAGSLTEEVRAKSIAAGRPWVVDMDETTPAEIGLSDANAPDLRKRVLWDVYLSGGQVEWYAGQSPLPVGGDTTLEDFRTREEMWTYTRHARTFLEALPFWLMEPSDGLLAGESPAFGGGEVLALAGEAYAVYLPDASQAASLDLSGVSGPFDLRWFDPRSGNYGPTTKVTGGGLLALGTPPAQPGEDWAVVVRRPSLWTTTKSVSSATGGTVVLELDGTPAMAGWSYVVLGSISGTAPGLTLGSGLVLPLVYDLYSQLILSGGAPISGGAGLLDEAGRATATVDFPAAPAVVGLRVYHAWIGAPNLADIPSVATMVLYAP
ncbi:DUF5060 domain-containing protein [Engelhardtia mirabilis]|uniref:DUF5060 domain-containing protein n=1 Tax=Engelhardtia mirabilis TaxID=2528011 RepID=A0A518BP03_9BACT|nr:hypothetical protein Pla133_38150 [Planctomycetes bacterium Pla133]QDV03039.1 hypothetical protein Pla86_38140 [Planctomycetes bacterium Pla86]